MGAAAGAAIGRTQPRRTDTVPPGPNAMCAVHATGTHGDAAMMAPPPSPPPLSPGGDSDGNGRGASSTSCRAASAGGEVSRWAWAAAAAWNGRAAACGAQPRSVLLHAESLAARDTSSAAAQRAAARACGAAAPWDVWGAAAALAALAGAGLCPLAVPVRGVPAGDALVLPNSRIGGLSVSSHHDVAARSAAAAAAAAAAAGLGAVARGERCGVAGLLPLRTLRALSRADSCDISSVRCMQLKGRPWRGGGLGVDLSPLPQFELRSAKLSSPRRICGVGGDGDARRARRVGGAVLPRLLARSDSSDSSSRGSTDTNGCLRPGGGLSGRSPRDHTSAMTASEGSAPAVGAAAAAAASGCGLRLRRIAVVESSVCSVRGSAVANGWRRCGEGLAARSDAPHSAAWLAMLTAPLPLPWQRGDCDGVRRRRVGVRSLRCAARAPAVAGTPPVCAIASAAFSGHSSCVM
eukprot:64752-Chlamydomonas_euryale.AAC.7